MKKLSLSGLLAILIAFAFYACQDLSTNTSGTTSTTATVQTTQATIIHPNYDVQLASYVSPTIETPASFNPNTLEAFFPCPPPPPPPPGGKGGKGGQGGDGSRTFTPPPPPGGGDGSRTWTPPPPPGGGDGSRTWTPPPPPGGGNGSHTFTPPPPPGGGNGSHTITVGNGGKHPIELPFIPRNLVLTSDQVTLIQTMAQTYFNCIQAVMNADRPQMLAVVQAENAARKTILDSLNKGLIKRQAAMADLRYADSVAQAQLLKISQDPALCVCLKTYLDAVRTTLTPDQQIIWDAYIASLKGFCFSTVTPTK